MPRDLTITVTDEQDAAAKEHGDTITVEQVITERLDGLVSSAEGLRAQKLEVRKSALKPEDQADLDALDAQLQKNKDDQLEAALLEKENAAVTAELTAEGLTDKDPTWTERFMDMFKKLFGG